MNPAILGVRLDMLAFLYWRRLRAHPLAELLAGGGVAIGVALVFGVLLANSSLTSSAGRLVHGLAGSARWELAARSPQGFDAHVVEEVGELEGVQVAAPILRQNVTLIGPKGRRAVQLIGVTPSLEDLGGATTQQLAAGTQLLKGGLGLPSGVAGAIGARPGQTLALASGVRVRPTRERSLFGDAFADVSASPVAVASLEVAQSLTGRYGRVSELMVRPRPGLEHAVEAQLARIAAAQHLDLRPADSELRLLEAATRPQRQSTTLFTAIAAMIGFLLALNAMLLTVPERRRFIAELRVLGYDARQVVLLTGLQALVLGVVASAAGVALGALLAHASFQQVPGFLTAAFPIGSEERASAGTVAGAIACGVLATGLASASPLLDLRAGRPLATSIREAAARSESVASRTIALLALAGALLLALAVGLALAVPSLTVAGGVALAVAAICLVPGVFWCTAGLMPHLAGRVRSSALVVAVTETRAITTRSLALGAIVGLAVYGGVAVGGARQDLLRGIDRASREYFGTAQVWVSEGGDVFDTGAFPAARSQAALERLPQVASVRVYRGGLLDVGDRRMWVRARPVGDGAMLEASQLLRGDYASATRLIGHGGWAAVSSDFAGERHLHVGDALALPTPSGTARLGVAAIMTNSGWPAGTLTLSGADFARLWGRGEAAALEVSLRAGVGTRAARRAVAAALAGMGLQVSTAAERLAESDAAARQGLRTLGQIASLLLVAAALAVASALSAAIWQRRMRLAAMKLHGYDSGQLWLAVLIESAATIGGGALVGALVGLTGHAFASRFLQEATGFPAPFAAGLAQLVLTVALFVAIAVAVLALPGAAAACVSPRAALQE